MNREFEKILYTSIQIDIKSFFQNNKSVAENYEDCIYYLEEIITIIKDHVSNELLTKLNLEKDYYQEKIEQIEKKINSRKIYYIL